MSENSLYLLRPYDDDELRANLREFVESTDRGPPPVFAGRGEIIDRITNAVARCRLNTMDTACFTHVIHGAPGAGKTSLLTEIRQRLSVGSGSVGPLTVVLVEWDELSDKARIASKFINAYHRLEPHISTEKSTTTTKKVGYRGTGYEHQTTTIESSIKDQTQSEAGLWGTILEKIPNALDEAVFLLLVDESQNIEGDISGPTGKNTIVANLHTGFNRTDGLKIVPVFAGLSDTVSVLADRGVSRLSRDSAIRLGSLSEGETEELVNRWMQHEAFGFDNLFSDADIARVSKMIAVSSEGWPRHVNGYLSELARSVLEQGVSNELKIDLDDVLDRGHDDRLTYYQQRLRIANLGRYAGAIRDATQQSEDGVINLDTLDMLVDEKYPSVRLDAEALCAKAIRSGILEYASDDDAERFKFPTPSFFTYMHLGRDAVKFKAKMREQMDGESHRWSKPNALAQ